MGHLSAKFQWPPFVQMTIRIVSLSFCSEKALNHTLPCQSHQFILIDLENSILIVLPTIPLNSLTP